MLTEHSNSRPNNIDADTLTSWLLENVSRVLGVEADEIDIDGQLIDYGMDSRQFVELKSDLQELLGRELPASLLWDSPSIAMLVKALMKLPAV
jgi:acyl carrier protein